MTGGYNETSDREKPFFGHINAKEKRLRLQTLKHYIACIFEISKGTPGLTEAVRGWVSAQKGGGISLGECHLCGVEAPFYFDYCLFCGDRERSITTMEATHVKENAAKKAIEEKVPFPHFGHARVNGKCDLHPDSTKDEDYVLTIKTTPGEKGLILCILCARFLTEKLVCDYWRETRKKQDVGEYRTFWGSTFLLKADSLLEGGKKEVA